MNIKVISQYDHLPNHHPKDGETCPRLYVDEGIWTAQLDDPAPTDMLMLIEPRCLQSQNYDIAMTGYSRFRHIFTHDSQLLSLAPNALPIYYWRDYELKDCQNKTKGISMICGKKQMCPIHVERIKLADRICNKVNVLGDLYGERCSIDEAYSDYRFAVIVENYRDDWWFTEKILNCFSHKTIPIYYGARNISHVFNGRGIIEVQSFWNIPDIIDILLEKGLDSEYKQRIGAINNNYNIVQEYLNFEDYFFTQYGYLMDELGGELGCIS